jgi:hypothetical protein
MCKRSIVAAAALLFVLSPISRAQARRSGVGLILIEPSGLTGKAWLSRSTALQGAVGWSPQKDNRLHLSADILLFNFPLQGDRNLGLELYLGLGGKIVFRDNDQVGVRFPVGVDFLLRKAPLNFFFEIVPTYNLSRIELFGALGFRYIFGQ